MGPAVGTTRKQPASAPPYVQPHGKENQKSLTDKAEIVALKSFLARVGCASLSALLLRPTNCEYGKPTKRLMPAASQARTVSYHLSRGRPRRSAGAARLSSLSSQACLLTAGVIRPFSSHPQAVHHRAEQTSRLADLRPESVPGEAADGDHWLVAIDRHETNLYHTVTKARQKRSCRRAPWACVFSFS